MRVEVVARVQHHPSRAHLIPALLGGLAPLPVEVIEHSSTPPNPWAGYRRCFADLPECSHVLIVQDDVVPAPNTPQAVAEIAAANPATPVCLFISHLPRDTKPRIAQAMKMNRRYVTLSLRSFLPVVAMLWPREKLVEFAAWTEANPYLPGTRDPRSDDAMGGRWKAMTKQVILATVPSLFEHPDIEPSTIGKTRQWGGERGRSALFLADDAGKYDWSMP